MRDYRYMRTILFFDLPTLTSKQRKSYRDFVKKIKSIGFFMLQESVYSKMSINEQASEVAIRQAKAYIPSEGSVFALTITEKQFSSMDFLLGEYHTDILENDNRLVEL